MVFIGNSTRRGQHQSLSSTANIKFYFRIIIGPRLRRLAGDVFVVPRFSDSVAPIGAAFKQTRTWGSAPRVSPKPRRGAGLKVRSIAGGGDHPRLDKGYGRSMPATTRRAGTSSARRPATEAAGAGVSDRDTDGEGAAVLQGNRVGPDSQPAEETSSGSEYGTGEGEPEAEPEPEAEEEAVGNGGTSADDGQENSGQGEEVPAGDRRSAPPTVYLGYNIN